MVFISLPLPRGGEGEIAPFLLSPPPRGRGLGVRVRNIRTEKWFSSRPHAWKTKNSLAAANGFHLCTVRLENQKQSGGTNGFHLSTWRLENQKQSGGTNGFHLDPVPGKPKTVWRHKWISSLLCAGWIEIRAHRAFSFHRPWVRKASPKALKRRPSRAKARISSLYLCRLD